MGHSSCWQGPWGSGWGWDTGCRPRIITLSLPVCLGLERGGRVRETCVLPLPCLFTLDNLQLCCGNHMQINSLAFQANRRLPNAGSCRPRLQALPNPPEQLRETGRAEGLSLKYELSILCLNLPVYSSPWINSVSWIPPLPILGLPEEFPSPVHLGKEREPGSQEGG